MNYAELPFGVRIKMTHTIKIHGDDFFCALDKKLSVFSKLRIIFNKREQNNFIMIKKNIKTKSFRNLLH